MTKNIQDDHRLSISAAEIPLDSSLGLLAYGDIAFTAWRTKKKASNGQESDRKK